MALNSLTTLILYFNDGEDGGGQPRSQRMAAMATGSNKQTN